MRVTHAFRVQVASRLGVRIEWKSDRRPRLDWHRDREACELYTYEKFNSVMAPVFEQASLRARQALTRRLTAALPTRELTGVPLFDSWRFLLQRGIFIPYFSCRLLVRLLPASLVPLLHKELISDPLLAMAERLEVQR